MRSNAIALILAVIATVAHAADEPLRVYAFDAPGASVYVAPLRATAAGEATSAEIGRRSFDKQYLRGTVPVETRLRPGQYLVSVVLPAERNMRDASLKAGEFVWDGYDYHALVGQKNNTWRYAQCYVLEKKQGFPAEILAVFTDRMPLDQVLSFDCSPQATRYAGTEEDAAGMLEAERIPLTFHDDIIQGVAAGMKVLLRAGERRLAIQPDGPANLRIMSAYGQGAWAGHRLSIIPYE